MGLATHFASMNLGMSRWTPLFGIASMLVFTNCSKKAETAAITADDVAWATDWKIFKKPLKSITRDPVYSVGLVVLNENGEIISEGPWCGGGEGPAFSGDSMVSVALKRNGDRFECKLRVGGGGVSSELSETFGKSFSWNPDFEILDDILLLASDVNGMPGDAQSCMKAKGKKIGIKVYREKRRL